MKLVGQVPLADLAGGNMVRLKYPPYDVLVTLVDEVPYALEDACNHAGASLSEGERDARCVTCPVHGYIFDITTGELLIPEGMCSAQRTFVARVEGPNVVIWDPFSLKIF